MGDSTLQLLFSANTEDLDKASEKLVGLGSHMPTVGEAIEGLAKSFAGLPAPIALAAAAAAGFAIAAAEGASKAMEQIDALEKLSDQAGVSAEKMQVMQVAMGMTGQSTDELGTMFNKLNKNIMQSADPTSKSAVAFGMLGISQKELKNSSPDEIMMKVAKALNEIAPGANKAALEMQILGKAGAEQDAALKSMAENGDKAIQMLKDHGAISADDIETQQHLNASLNEAKLAFQGMGLAVLREVTPAIQAIVQWFDNATKVSGPFITKVKEIWEGTKELAVEMWNLAAPFRELIEAIFQSTKGFADGATQGSYFKELIKTLGEAFTYAVGLIKPFVEGIFNAFQMLKTFGQGIVAVGNAIVDLAHRDFAAAAQEFVKFREQVKENNQAALDFADAVESTHEPLKKQTVFVGEVETAAEKAQRELDALNAKMKALAEAAKYAEAMEKLKVEIAGQTVAATQAGKSLEDYKRDANAAAIGAEALALHLTEGSKAFIAFVAAKQKLAGLKDDTKDEVAGKTAIAKLQEEINALTSKGTALEKARAEIAAHPAMLKADQDLLIEKAKLLDADKQQLEVDKSVAAMKASVTKDINSEKAAMTLSTTALKLYTQEAKLTAQAEKDAFGKTPEQIQKIKAALKDAKKELEDNDTATKAWTSSMAGFNAGATQAFANAYNEATNLNKLGGQLATTFNTGVTDAFIKMAEGGKDAFKQLMTSMLELIAKQALGVLLIEAEAAVLKALGVDPNVISTLMGTKPVKNAKGNAFSDGSITAFANGGVVGQTTIAPMAMFGEEGPEAIMPLQRNSAGQLGVHVSSGSGGGGGVVNNHHTFVINSNQPATDVAKKTKQATQSAAKFTKSTMTQQKRPGGILSTQPHAFAR